MMDEWIIAILQAMANSTNCYNDNSGYMECIYCFCSGDMHGWDEVEHNANCPIIVARTKLKELDIAP